MTAILSGGRKVTFGELYRRRWLRKSESIRRSWRGAGGPNDGLDSRDQL